MCLESIGALGLLPNVFKGSIVQVSCQKNREYMFKAPKIEFARLTGCTESFSQPLCPYRGEYPYIKRLVFWRLTYMIYPDLIQVIPKRISKQIDATDIE